MFEKLYDGAYQLKIPFQNIYTSVFAFACKDGYILLDSGNNAEEVEKMISPALQKAGLLPCLFVCSHLHSDHCGGVEQLLKEYPHIKVGLFAENAPYPNERVIRFRDGELLYGRYGILNLKGHTDDCLAIWDEKENVLFSCDCLQAKGVGRYPTFYEDKEKYLKTIERVRALDLSCIIASHAYEPYGGTHVGDQEIKRFLDICVRYTKS